MLSLYQRPYRPQECHWNLFNGSGVWDVWASTSSRGFCDGALRTYHIQQNDHENVGKEDDDGDEVEGMVDGESPVTQVWLLIAGVLTHQVENILEGLGDEGGGESFLSQIYWHCPHISKRRQWERWRDTRSVQRWDDEISLCSSSSQSTPPSK